MTKHEGPCKLCGQVGPLCLSHIVPEFVYGPIKNERGQVALVGRKTRLWQTGYRERLLCSECEGRLSVWETKFRKMWMDAIPRDFPSFEGHILVPISDFPSFKLFHLSILWRSAVSHFQAPGPRISLGRYEREIAQMLLNGDPGAPGDFFFFAVLNLDAQKRPVGAIVPIAQGEGRIDGHHYYQISYAYCDWTFIIARPGPDWLVELESDCRRGNVFPLLVQPHSQSKLFRLGVHILRKLRDRGPSPGRSHSS